MQRFVYWLQWLFPVAVALATVQVFLGNGFLLPVALRFPWVAALVGPSWLAGLISIAVVAGSAVAWRQVISRFVPSGWASSFLAAISLVIVPAVRSDLFAGSITLISIAALLWATRRRELAAWVLVGVFAGALVWPVALVLPLLWHRRFRQAAALAGAALLVGVALTWSGVGAWSGAGAGALGAAPCFLGSISWTSVAVLSLGDWAAVLVALALATVAHVRAEARGHQDLALIWFALVVLAPFTWRQSAPSGLAWALVLALAGWTITALGTPARFGLGAAGLWWSYLLAAQLPVGVWSSRQLLVALIAPAVLLAALALFLFDERVPPLARAWRVAAAFGFPLLFLGVITLMDGTKRTLRLHQFVLIDFEVYHRAGARVLADVAIYQPDRLPWIYGPFAAIAMTPLGALPLWLASGIWVALSIALIFLVVRYFGFSWWQTSLLTAASIYTVPIHQSFYTGQIGVVLLALVFFDFVGRNQRATGFWFGVATMVKLTPGAIVAAFGAAGRFKLVFWAGIGFLATTGLGFLLRYQDSYDFWRLLLTGNLRGLSDYHRSGNQTFYGALLRFGVESSLIRHGFSVLVIAFGCLAVAVVYRRGYGMLALNLAALVSLVAAPVSWSHGFIWIIPLGLWALTGTDIPRRTRMVSAFVVFWFCWGIYLRIAKGDAIELRYPISLQLVSGGGPLLVLLLLAVALHECWPLPHREYTTIR